MENGIEILKENVDLKYKLYFLKTEEGGRKSNFIFDYIRHPMLFGLNIELNTVICNNNLKHLIQNTNEYELITTKLIFNQEIFLGQTYEGIATPIYISRLADTWIKNEYPILFTDGIKIIAYGKLSYF